MIAIRFPVWRLSAVGSNPTYTALPGVCREPSTLGGGRNCTTDFQHLVNNLTHKLEPKNKLQAALLLHTRVSQEAECLGMINYLTFAQHATLARTLYTGRLAPSLPVSAAPSQRRERTIGACNLAAHFSSSFSTIHVRGKPYN